MIGERIRQLRLEKGTTQKNLSDYLGVTPKTISFYEAGQRFPSQSYISKIAKYFDVTTDYLLGASEVKTSSEEDELKRLKTQLNNELELLPNKKNALERDLERLKLSLADAENKVLRCKHEISCLAKDIEDIDKNEEQLIEKIAKIEKKLREDLESKLYSKVDLVKEVMPSILEYWSKFLTPPGLEVEVPDNKGNIISGTMPEILKQLDFETQLKGVASVIDDISIDTEEEQHILSIYFKNPKNYKKGCGDTNAKKDKH